MTRRSETSGGVIENIYLGDIRVRELNNAAIRINQNYFSKAVADASTGDRRK